MLTSDLPPLELSEFFKTPENYISKSEKPVTALINLAPDIQVELEMTENHSLYAHLYRKTNIFRITNASKSMAKYIINNKHVVNGKRVLELGSGSGLLSIVALICGASSLVCTDYPDPSVILAIRKNMKRNLPNFINYEVFGHEWGTEITGEYDVILGSDLIFYHLAHNSLLQSIRRTLAPAGSAYLSFSHHFCKFKDREMRIFDASATEYQLHVSQVYYEVGYEEMFSNSCDCSVGCDISKSVFCYSLSLTDNNYNSK